MSKKSELLSLFDTMRATVAVYREQREKVESNKDLSEVGRARQILAIEEQTADIIQGLHKQALQILEQARTEQARAWEAGTVGRLSDQGYQVGLQNVLQMLQLQAIPPEGIPDIVKRYRMDSNAMNAFRKIVEGYDQDTRSRYRIPGDDRKATERALQTVERDVRTFMSGDALKNDRFDTQLALTKKYHFEPLSEDLTAEA